MGDWEFVKRRTAADGSVWRSCDGLYYKRTGDVSVGDEADLQLSLAELGYPVPQITDRGVNDGQYYFVERSAGVSLHDQALADADDQGRVGASLISDALRISVLLLEAQAHHPILTSEAELRTRFERAAFAANVRAENPTWTQLAPARQSSAPCTDCGMCQCAQPPGLRASQRLP